MRVFLIFSFRCKQLVAANPNSFDSPSTQQHRLKTGSKGAPHRVGFYFKVHFNPILRAGGLRVLREFLDLHFVNVLKPLFFPFFFFSQIHLLYNCV